jgi:hypothetical protein
VGGQKLRASETLMLREKLKQKKSKKGDFLILFLNLKNLIFFLIKSSKNYKIILKNHRFLIKNLEKLSIKNKIKKSPFLEFFHFNFLHNLKTFVVVGFLTPHDSRNLTTVKFLESAPPQGGS